MPSLDEVLCPSPDVISREAEGELVVVQPERGKFVVLNKTGAQVMALANCERTLGEIAAEMAAAFDTDVAQVEADVLKFAATLTSRGVLVAKTSR